jgi:hypothetical protein
MINLVGYAAENRIYDEWNDERMFGLRLLSPSRNSQKSQKMKKASATIDHRSFLLDFSYPFRVFNIS